MKKISVAEKLLIITAIAFAVRFLFCAVYWVNKPVTHDAQEYLLLAGNIVEGKGFTYEMVPGDKVEHHERAPIYPVFLTVIFSIFGKNYLAIKIIQALIASFLPLIIFGTAKILFDERTGLIAAWIVALYPPLIWGTAEFLSESLFTVIAMAGFYYLAKYSRDDLSRDLLIAVLYLLIAAHTKPVMLMSFPFIVFWICFRKKTDRSTALKHAALFTIVTILLLIPWTVRNYTVQKKFILIASEGGITFWTGNNPLAVGDGDMAANPQIKKANNNLRKNHGYPSPAEMERIYYHEALKFIKTEPVSFIALLVKKSFYFWFPIGRSMSLFSLKHQLASHLSYFPILLLAGIAAIKLIRAGKTPFLPLISMFSAMIACVIFFPQERYRIPMTDPFLILLAASFIAGKCSVFEKNDKRKRNR
jgi:4-amino-4-deoxy-L-arabinose transferase-like glycosyltransferase